MKDSYGRKVLARFDNGERVITLADVGGYQPFVTWASRSDRPDDTFWGHYFVDAKDALDDFSERCKRGY